MDNRKPQHFTSSGLTRNKKLQGMKKTGVAPGLFKSSGKLQKQKTRLSEEAARQIALVLSGMLRKQ